MLLEAMERRGLRLKCQEHPGRVGGGGERPPTGRLSPTPSSGEVCSFLPRREQRWGPASGERGSVSSRWTHECVPLGGAAEWSELQEEPSWRPGSGYCNNVSFNSGWLLCKFELGTEPWAAEHHGSRGGSRPGDGQARQDSALGAPWS